MIIRVTPPQTTHGHLKRTTDPELKNRREIELAVRQRATHRQLHFRLDINTTSDLHIDGRCRVNPVAGADQHLCALTMTSPSRRPIREIAPRGLFGDDSESF